MKPAEILRELKKLPNKVLGQNFLVDDSVLRDMITAAEIKEGEAIIEIGPGLGVLTEQLADKTKRLLAIETDQDFVNYLRGKYKNHVKIIHGDALKINWTITLDQPYRIIASIPYSITSPLLRKVFLLEKRPEKVVLLIQKEVAKRLTAPPGSSERGFLTLLTEANADVRIIRTVKPGSFHPSPRVDSAIVSITPLSLSKMAEIFWPAVGAGFRHKRQTLCNALSKDLKLAKSSVINLLQEKKLDPLTRAQNLSFEDWTIISRQLVLLLNSKRD